MCRPKHCRHSLLYLPGPDDIVSEIGQEKRIMKGSNFLKKAVFWPAVFVCILAIASAAASFGYRPAGVFTSGYAEIRGKDTVSKIVSVLAIRSSSGKVIGKAAEKLSAMNDRDLRLISSLCDRISADHGSAGADIAFSLITAMIVLS
jgi:hypothetical protein